MRVIDADVTQKIADEELSVEDAGTVQYVLSHTPTIEAEPVRHGRWEEEDERSAYKDFLVSCSNCGALLDKNKALYFKYCYNCGWPMDGGVSNER